MVFSSWWERCPELINTRKSTVPAVTASQIARFEDHQLFFLLGSVRKHHCYHAETRPPPKATSLPLLRIKHAWVFFFCDFHECNISVAVLDFNIVCLFFFLLFLSIQTVTRWTLTSFIIIHYVTMYVNEKMYVNVFFLDFEMCVCILRHTI